MAKPSKFYRFRANPVEILIFLAVSAIFVRSIYQLAYNPEVLTTMAAAPAATPTQGRAPASAQAFLNLEVSCESNTERETAASKVRLTGNLCTKASGLDATKLVRTAISNEANKFAATVFTDVRGGKFSTDYIPLNVGSNPIRLEFTYRDGQTITQELNIVKN